MHPNDLRDAEQSLLRFFDHLDERRYAAMLALMAPDAVWHRQGRSLRGPAQILAALEERSPTQRIRHVVTNLLQREAPAGEIALSNHMTAYRFDDGAASVPPVTIAGPFRLSLVRTRWVAGAGGWLIAEQSIDAEFAFAEPSAAR